MGETSFVLAVDGSDRDVQQIREFLSGNRDANYEVESVSEIGEALRRLGRGGIALVLLNLTSSFEQRTAIDLLERIHVSSREGLPVIVLVNDEQTGMDSLKHGAHDYLIKGGFTRDTLRRAVKYALERYQLLRHEAERSARYEHDLRRLRDMASPGTTPVSAVAFGQGPLSKERPEAFDQLVGQYTRLLEAALEQVAYRIESDLSHELQKLAERLGFLFATPRDVVSIHTEALRRLVSHVLPQRAQVMADEGRLMVLELMGFLASYYRTYALRRSATNHKEHE
ncbi:response regulator [bacterium]|nr:response regulator [bacterium]